MPQRYYFNFCENGRRTADHEGLEMASTEEAQRQASDALASIFAEHVRADGPNLHAEVVVEDAEHSPIFEAEISYAAKVPSGR